MASTFAKETLRSIRGSLGRFVAIAAIVALGCGFYAGLRMTSPDMAHFADEYYDGTALMDIRVVSTLGLTDADLEALRGLDDVEAAMGAYETDVMATIDGEQYAVRVHSLPESAAASVQVDAMNVESDDSSYLNRLVLTEGRWPEQPGECIISADRVMATPTAVGDEVKIDYGASDVDEVLKTRRYTIVGYATTPYYVSSTQMGSTSLGSGVVEQFMYVPEDDFAESYPYTEAFVTVSGARDEMAGSFDYQARVDAVLKEIAGLAPERERERLAQLRADAQAELNRERERYEAERADAEAQLDDARASLDAAAAAIRNSEAELAQGQADYDSGVVELAAQRKAAEEGFAAAGAELAARQQQLDGIERQIAQVEQALADPSLPADERAKLEAQLAELQKGAAALAQGIAAGRQQLADRRAAAEAGFAEAQQKLDSAQAQLASGHAQLASGRAGYESGLAEYEQGHAEADERFADAEAQLADAQHQIDAIELPEWLVMDRTKNHGLVSFESDAERVDHIAQVFPVIFFLVAALVALTTMTRMVEEERGLIGTFKALGYSRARITSKYLVYAALASVAGAVVGIVVMALVLPCVIMEAYAIIYSVPKAVPPIDVPLALLAAGLGIGVTLGATWFACAATLRESPAELMRPRAPKEGKRILLERVRPLWRRLSFSWKVTFRNIFRYKKRLVMTLIGIAGCTALLLTGLGLQDSINDIIDKQYGRLVHYNVVVTTEDDMGQEGRGALGEVMGGDVVSEYTEAQQASMMALAADGSETAVSLVVPQDPAAFQSLWTMQERQTGRELELGPDSAIITEKLASTLDAQVGSTVELAVPDDMGNATAERYELRVTGIMENYVQHYVFLGAEAYERAFGKPPVYTATYALMDADPSARAAFSDEVRAIDGVKTVAYNDEVIDSYRTMLRSVNMIVVVLVVAAAALAFIVLYNLTNINITERQREIATLKVLGFTPREVDLYIYRETIVLSVMGGLVGLGLGVRLEGFVIVTAEVDQVMFGRDIHLWSFMVAFVLTMAFTVFVMVTMRRKLARIDMVESLKSNE